VQIDHHLFDKCERDRPEQGTVIKHFVGPLLETKSLPNVHPQAYVAELVVGIAAKAFDAKVLDLALARARTQRSTMPSLPMCLQLLNSIDSELAAEGATSEASSANDDNATQPADPDTAAFQAQLVSRVSNYDFRTWGLNSLRVERVNETKVIISAPDDGVRRMLAKDYARYIVQQVEMASRATFGERVARVEIVVREADQPMSSADRDCQLRSEMRALELWISGARWDPQFGPEPKSHADAHGRIAEIEARISEDFQTSPPSKPGSTVPTEQGVAQCG
jgi:hypothetical protein